MSNTGTSDCAAFTPSLIIVMQNGHATAIVSAPVASSSSVRSTLMRLPCALFHEHPSAAGAAAEPAILRARRLDEIDHRQRAPQRLARRVVHVVVAAEIARVVIRDGETLSFRHFAAARDPPAAVARCTSSGE